MRYDQSNHPGRMRVRRNLENGGISWPDGSVSSPAEAADIRAREYAEQVKSHEEFLARQASESARAAYATRQLKAQQRELTERNRQTFAQAIGAAPYVDPMQAERDAYRRKYLS